MLKGRSLHHTKLPEVRKKGEKRNKLRMWVESEEEKKEVKEKKKTIEILTSWKHTKTDDHFFAVVFASQ